MSSARETVDSEDMEPASTVGRNGAQTPDLTGVTLGDFQVESLIGQGGMGSVYLARQISLNRPVAIKVLKPDLIKNPNYLSRFEAEAWAAAKLNHPNVVHIYAFSSVNDIRFIAMEYVEGTNLRDYLRKKKRIELPLAISIIRQAAMAIGAAGELGLIHRDIKPENLLLKRNGLVKVADFGLCRDIESDRMHLTQPGMTMGTPLYMSPEQVQGHPIDHRSDLYSLGVTCYHMLAGSPPFKGESSLAIALKHVKDQPIDLSVHRPDLPVEFTRIVMKLMNKRPEDRYQTAGEMLRDLARAKDGASTSVATSAAMTDASSSAVNSQTLDKPAVSGSYTGGRSWARLIPGKRGRIALVVAAGVLGMVIGWMSRAEDLTTVRPMTEETNPPGIWLAPEWSAMIPRMPNAERQFHYAQIMATPEEREAAWLSVPGYFYQSPAERIWSFKAYAHLGRDLLLRGDQTTLRSISRELEIEPSNRPDDKELARLYSAAAWALDDDLEAVAVQLGEYENTKPESVNAVLLPLLAEILHVCLRSKSINDSGDLQRFRNLETKFVRMMPNEFSPGPAQPNRREGVR
jgi:serine/threonine protein kinase